MPVARGAVRRALIPAAAGGLKFKEEDVVMKSKELRAKRFKIIEDARAAYPSDRLPTAEEQAKWDAAMTEADGLFVQIKSIEAGEALVAGQAEALRNAGKLQGRSPDEVLEAAMDEEEAFDAWMRGGLG